MNRHGIDNQKSFDRIKMQKKSNYTFLKNQPFRFVIRSLVTSNLKEHSIHQNKAEDI